MELLEKALTKKKAAQWTKDLNLDPSTIATAKRRGSLSPVLAGVMAEELHEDIEHWIAVAAIETETRAPTALVERIKQRWRKR